MFYACVGSRRWVRRPFDPACMPQSGFYLGLFVRATTTNAQIFPLSSQRPTLLPERLPSALPPSAISAPLYQDLYYNNMKSVACVLALAGSAAAFAPAGTSSSVGFLSGFVRISLFRLGISLGGGGRVRIGALSVPHILYRVGSGRRCLFCRGSLPLDAIVFGLQPLAAHRRLGTTTSSPKGGGSGYGIQVALRGVGLGIGTRLWGTCMYLITRHSMARCRSFWSAKGAPGALMAAVGWSFRCCGLSCRL